MHQLSEPQQQESRQEWTTKIGIVMAVAGSAVGLGNFLRFPGQAAANGGGAFMIPYFIALLLLGIPIGWAEWTMGRYGGQRGFHSAPAILGAVARHRAFRYIGVVGVLIPLVVSFYYTYIEAWCLAYALKYLAGGIGISTTAPIAEQTAAAKDFFVHVTGQLQNGLNTGDTHFTFYCWIVTFVINIFLVYRGISGGIEKFCSLAMPTMAVCAIVVLGRVLTLGTPDPSLPDQNVINGLGYMWTPKWEYLVNPETWVAAAGQIFFSLSVGFGVIINYASYMKKKSDVVLSGLTASATNEVFEVSFGGLITLTAAFIFLGAAGTASVQGSTFGLGFSTLPVVFGQMGGLGNIIGFVWFFMLFLAAITSSISMYQPSLAFFQEALGWSKQKTTTMLVSTCVFGSFLTMYFSKDLMFLDTLDSWVGTLFIFILGSIQLICFGWMFDLEKGWEEAHQGSSVRIPSFYKIVIKYIAPLYLLIIFGSFCYKNLPEWIKAVAEEPTRQYAVGLIFGIIALLVVCLVAGEKRWEEKGLGLEGKAE